MKDTGSTAKTQEDKCNWCRCVGGCVYACVWVLYGWGVGTVWVLGRRCCEHLRVKMRFTVMCSVQGFCSVHQIKFKTFKDVSDTSQMAI